MTEELKSHFKNLYRMMMSDDDIHEQELMMLYQLAIDKGIPEQDIDNFLGEPIEGDEVFAPHETLIKIEYLYDLARMAWADGNVDDREKDTLVRFCTSFGFAEENIPLIIEFLLEEAKRGASKQAICYGTSKTNPVKLSWRSCLKEFSILTILTLYKRLLQLLHPTQQQVYQITYL